MKNFIALLMFIAQVAASGYLLVVEGWVSGIVFFVITTVLIGLVLSFNDAVSTLFRPRH